MNNLTLTIILSMSINLILILGIVYFKFKYDELQYNVVKDYTINHKLRETFGWLSRDFKIMVDIEKYIFNNHEDKKISAFRDTMKEKYNV